MNGSASVNGSSGGGYADRRAGSYDDRSSRPGYADRGDSRSGGFTGSNREPVRPRDGGGYGGGERDRDRYSSRGRDEEPSRKRHQEFDGYDDRRSRQRY